MPRLPSLRALGRSVFSLRRLSIKRRLLAAFLITSLLPVAVVAIYSNQKYEASITNKLSASSTQVLDQLAQNTTRELEQYETLSETIIINKLIQGGLPKFSKMADIEKSELRTRIKDELGQQIFSLSNLSNVIVMTNDGQSMFDLGFELYPEARIRELTTLVADSKSNAYWTGIRNNRGSSRIALSRRIFAENNLNRQIGYLIIVIDEKVFSRNTYESVDLGEGSSIYLSDAAGVVVSSLSPAIGQGSLYREKVFEGVQARRQASREERAFYADVDGERTLVTSSYIRSADWYLVGMIPRSFLVSELSVLRHNVVLICLLILLLAGMLAMWIYISISGPVRKLLQYANQVRMGQLQQKIGPSYPDEMGILAETIDRMVGRLKELIYQVESEQQAKRDAELAMLQAQINPHFLFNTLNSLKWSAMLGGNDAVSQGIASLSELLRNTILVKEELIPLDRELDNLTHYAMIQRIRYGDSFELELAIEDELRDCLVPKFILQPIVENSILHGGGDEGRSVRIKVTGERDGARVRIRIRDDGKGFDAVEAGSRGMSHAKLSGIGIGNVDERIRLHFGAPYGLTTASVVQEGTETTIVLPIVLPIVLKGEKGDVQNTDRG
ncbi:two-component system, sensor histidine kinase YesM [Cohnella sp. OV330]|uniref:sensor histidine kinase n=1 Tax=Cohnella sp. OV330 TaxID=1855288 RepID=UPI0008E12ED1|nr:sensor histidine kinase [Cohnella sp. OV330]SFB49053.1 two-component system, sensor histidine kinase YesM [Cohnella sp. OV330]